MKTVLKFDRVILTKELNEKIKKVGDVFEVANVLDNSFLLRDANTKVAVGVISFEDFENYFVHEENFKGWTKWSPIVGFDGQTDAMYRTNRKKVQVEFLTKKVRCESCCNKKAQDEFNLSFGIKLAYLRCLNRVLTKQKNEHEDKIKTIDHEIADNKNIIKRMYDSLKA